MPLVETLTVALGGAVSRAVIRRWLGDDGVVGDLAEDVGTLIERRVSSARAQRRLKRQLEAVADQVAERLEPYFIAEFSTGVPENEREAAASAVGYTIDRGSARDVILGVDLDPRRLEAVLRSRTPDAAQRYALSEAGTALYNFALREACDYIVEIAVSLPDFDAAATQELLKRDTEIIALVQKVLDHMPAPIPEGPALGSDIERFETQYRRFVARNLDRLSLFGVNVSERSQRYALSVAYITLSATKRTSRARRDDLSTDGRDGPQRDSASQKQSGSKRPPEDQVYVRIDEILRDTPRALVRGEAGSGKTTLLQWLAVTSAKRGFTGGLADLNDRTPFFIPLRRFVDRELPRPAQFLDHAAPVASGAPEGWVERKLEDGQALVLIDGVDELPRHQREDARAWLTGLCTAFPESRFVVTSRPPAIGEDWLIQEGFAPSELQPMDLGDIDVFITHWHAAVLKGLTDDEDKRETGQLEDELKRRVRSTRPIRALATSPLLCAMLCALNRDRRAQLPSDRIELYEIALETLLERRDVERKVRDADVHTFTRKQKEILLRDLAYWLVLNNQTDVQKEVARERIEQKIDSMPAVGATAEVVLRHLLLRSGVIREPVEGHIDFVHRTFQEFLAAKEALHQEHIGVVLQNADRDEWAEVVVLAAGAGSLAQRLRIIRGLLQRGTEEPDIRHRLHLLAIACLETSPETPSELRGELERTLEQLVPPTNMSEARALSSAGDLAVPLMAQYHRSNVGIARACIRTLALVGTPEALDVLAGFGRDTRLTVVRELVRSWTAFDRGEYAEKVLAHSPLERGRLTVTEASVVPYLSQLSNLSSLWGDFTGATVDVAVLAGLPSLVYLRLNGNRALTSVAPLGGHPMLERLTLEDCPVLSDITGLRGGTLRGLSVKDCPIESLDAVRQLPGLAVLVLDAVAANDFSPLAAARNLIHLSVSRCDVRDLAWLPDAQLRVLRLMSTPVADIADLSRLSQAEHLTELHLRTLRLVSIDAVRRLSALRTLDVSFNESLADISPAGELPHLSELVVSGTAIHSFQGLHGTRVSEVMALRCPNLEDLADLRALSRLERLHLIGCTKVTDLSPLRDLPRLRHLDLEECSGVMDLSPLTALPALHWLDVSYCREDLDLSPLAATSALRTLRAYGMEDRVRAANLRRRIPQIQSSSYRPMYLDGDAVPS